MQHSDVKNWGGGGIRRFYVRVDHNTARTIGMSKSNNRRETDLEGHLKRFSKDMRLVTT